ncbi:MAG: TolC family protein [Bacteroidales bacterium]|nr:TolC family protein [Bacteroidales bacterium]
MKKTFLAFAALLVASIGTWGQTASPWTLDQCVEHAIQYNLDVKRQELTLKSTGQDHLQSKLDLLPNLNGMVEHQLGSGRILDRGTYEWKNANVSQGDLGLQSDLTLFNGLQGFNNMKMNKATYQMNMENLEALVDNVIIQVITGYLDLLRNQELVVVADTVVELTRHQVERMERLVEVGNEPRGRLLEVNAQLSAEKLAYTRAVNARDIAKLNLMHVMNLTDVDKFQIEKPILPDPSAIEIPDLDSVFQYALENLPQIKSAEFGIESMERSLAMQRGARSPRLYARGLLYTNYSDGLINPLDPDPANPTLDYPLSEQITNNQYRQVSMGLSIPFFNKWQIQTNINKAKLELQDAEYQYMNAVLVLQQTVQQYHTEALAAMDNYASAQEAVANSDEAYRFAEERFRVGTGTSLELQEARSQLYESASDMISSKYVLIFYTKILDFYMGREIVF